MEKLLVALSIALNFLAITTQAQVILTVKEESRNMSKGSNNAFVIEVPQTKATDLKKDWQKFLKDIGKLKIDDEKGELYTLNASISKISTNQLNHYALFTENATAATLVAFFQIKDTFVSSVNNQTTAANITALVREFGKAAYTNAVEDEIKTEKKALKKLQNELESFLKDEDKAKGSIAELKQKIEQNGTEIKVKKQEQELKQKEIMAQKEKIIGISLHKEEQKLQKKLISRMDSDKKKIIKAQSNLLKDIYKNESKIRETESEIVKIKEKQTAKTAEINKQKDVSQQVQNKLEAIKKF